jgi:corrinoid protein of di/trimethylamine methyltransferase
MKDEILHNLQNAVFEYDAQAARTWADEAVRQGIMPLEAVETLTAAIRVVGERYGCGELFLPELVGAANAMNAALPSLEQVLKASGAVRQTEGTVVIGSVRGDIHTIGKTLVATLLTAGGFEVHDLGVDIGAEQFLAAARQYNADILAMSALMTTTLMEQKRVIEMLTEAGLRDRVKVMVGGGAVNEAFARQIGADGYDPTAPGALELARKMMSAKSGVAGDGG